MGQSTHPFVRPTSSFPTALLLVDEIREAWRSEPRDHRIALVFIAVVTVTLRLMYLDQPMRYDESLTYASFVRQPWAAAFSLYPTPSHHLLHTLMVKAVAGVLGDAPWALRLPAFVAGLLIVPATYAVARVLYGGVAALFSAALVASSAVLTLYATNARGYSIVVLAFLLLVLIAARIIARPTRDLWMAFGVTAGIGVWTIPVMLYPLGAVCVWVVLSLLEQHRRAQLRGLVGALALAALIVILAYLPIVKHSGLNALTRNAWVTPAPWLDFFQTMSGMTRELLRSWSLGLPPIVSFALGLFAVVALRYHARVSRFRIGVPLAAFVWSCWVLVVNHRAPFARVFLWLLPLAAAVIGAGIVHVAERRPSWQRLMTERAPVMAIGLALVAFASLVLSRAVLLTRDTGTYRDAQQAAAILRGALRPGDRVMAAPPSTAPLTYYFDRIGIPQTYFTVAEQDTKRVILVVDAGEGQTVGGVIGTSSIPDTTHFARGTVLARLPNSNLFAFERRDVASK